MRKKPEKRDFKGNFRKDKSQDDRLKDAKKDINNKEPFFPEYDKNINWKKKTEEDFFSDKPKKPAADREKSFKERPFNKDNKTERPFNNRENRTERPSFNRDRAERPFFGNRREERSQKPKNLPTFSEDTRLNKYLAAAGVASRRAADEIILSGAVTVNGEVVTALGSKVKPGDVVKYGGQTLSQSKKVYVLLNKPKDYITTTDDERERRTVMELVANACKERLFPVGRLDRNTTGILLLTNDGDLSLKLTHPKFNIKKLYHAVLDKNFKAQDLKTLQEGLTLEDGFIRPDAVDYVEGSPKSEVGIEIHSGKNHIVRRIFEQLGYQVLRLDRVMFGNLTKADVPRGKWRFLTAVEVGFLKGLKE